MGITTNETEVHGRFHSGQLYKTELEGFLSYCKRFPTGVRSYIAGKNMTPIFVPNLPSLTSVFRTAIQKLGLDAKDISVVEAHGTGTPVGDPVEYDSIRQVFGGSIRAGQNALQIGSVKGLIGHTEGASGLVALIKILLMMQ
ncbi:polyketide synthase, partial [Metarhizium brunneum ARSEF 3297]